MASMPSKKSPVRSSRPHDSPDKAGEIGAVVVFEGVNEVSHGVFGLIPGVGIDALHVGFAPKEAFQGVTGTTVETGVGQVEPTRGADTGAGQRTPAHHATFAQKEGEGGTEGLPEVHAVGEFLDESEIELGFFAHHVAIPFGFEDEVDAHIFNTGDARGLDAYVFDDEVGGGTVGGGERHVDVEQSVVGEVYIIDEAEVVDVDGGSQGR